MKFNLFGTNQIIAAKYKLSIRDALLLTWARDIIGMPSCYTIYHENRTYYWLKIEQVLEDYPTLNLKIESLRKEFKKFADAGFFIKHSQRTPYGNFGYYAPSDKFEELFNLSVETHSQKNASGNEHEKTCTTHSQKNASEMQKNASEMQKNASIPLPNTLLLNTSSSLNGSDKFKDNSNETNIVNNLGEEEEEVFNFLRKKLSNVKDLNRIATVAKKHDMYSCLLIYKQTLVAINDINDSAKHIGILLSRLETTDKIKKNKQKTRKKNCSHTKKIVVTNEQIKNYIENLTDVEKVSFCRAAFASIGYEKRHTDSEIIKNGIGVIKNEFVKSQALLVHRGNITEQILSKKS